MSCHLKLSQTLNSHKIKPQTRKKNNENYSKKSLDVQLNKAHGTHNCIVKIFGNIFNNKTLDTENVKCKLRRFLKKCEDSERLPIAIRGILNITRRFPNDNKSFGNTVMGIRKAKGKFQRDYKLHSELCYHVNWSFSCMLLCHRFLIINWNHLKVIESATLTTDQRLFIL